MPARFRTKDRVLETSVTTGAGTYTLAGAATGFQTFAGGDVSSGDFVPYFAEDGVNWEAGIGEVLTGPARLVRTAVKASSNGGAAVNWGAGTRNLRCGWPAELNTPRVKSVSIAGGAGAQVLTQDEQRCDILILTGALTGNREVEVDTAPWRWIVVNNTSGAFSATLKVNGGTGVAVAQGKSKVLYCDGADVEEGNTDVVAVAGLPRGRITLTTAVPVTAADVTGAATVYYTPYNGNTVPIYNGATFVGTEFTELSQTTADNTKSPAAVANNSNYDLFVWNDAGTIRCTRGPAWTSDTARGAGAGTTELEMVNGILVNKIAITNGPAAQRGTYVGTIRSDGLAQINDSAAKRHVWNMYNRVERLLQRLESTATWNYTTATIRQARASTDNQVDVVRGLDEEPVDLSLKVYVTTSEPTNAYNMQAGIGLNTTTTFTGTGLGNVHIRSDFAADANARLVSMPGIGRHYYSWNEYSTAAATTTWYGNSRYGLHGVTKQ